MSDWVVVPAPLGRVHEVCRFLGQLNHQADCVVVVTTLPNPITSAEVAGYANHVVLFPEPGMLYGRWINAAMDYIAQVDPDARYALVAGSDTETNSHAFMRLLEGMQRLELVMGSPDVHKLGERVLNDRSRTVHDRVTPEFFVLDLRLGLRFDPEFRWWYGEDDLEMQARQHGQVGLIEHVWMFQDTAGHYLSVEQAQHAVEDRQKFIEKWGTDPW